jgi:hypothetical protein
MEIKKLGKCIGENLLDFSDALLIAFGAFVVVNAINVFNPHTYLKRYIDENLPAMGVELRAVTCMDAQLNEDIRYKPADMMDSFVNMFGVDHVSGMFIPAGEYHSESDTIYLNSNTITTPDENIFNSYKKLIYGDTNALVVLFHEEVHSVLEDRRAQLGLVSSEEILDEFKSEREYDKFMAISYIDEGLASYYEYKYQGHLPAASSDWYALAAHAHTKGYSRFRIDVDKYTVGYGLVKPIVDWFGPLGVDYLLLNPPTPEELNDLRAYQDSAFAKLRAYGYDSSCP